MRLLIKENLVARTILNNSKIVLKSGAINIIKIKRYLGVIDTIDKLFISLSLINLMIKPLINLIIRYKIHQE